jgi:hypothetical protein
VAQWLANLSYIVENKGLFPSSGWLDSQFELSRKLSERKIGSALLELLRASGEMYVNYLIYSELVASAQVPLFPGGCSFTGSKPLTQGVLRVF